METVLELDHVESGYGSLRILKGVSFYVRAGEIVTLIGSNGAGKTTTLNTISGLVRLAGGDVKLFGESLRRHEAPAIARLGIAHVPEGRRLFPDMTVRENLEMGAYLRRDKAGIRKDIEHMYELFPILRARQHTRAGALSGGEQQMGAIARGLMARPKVLLLDEPSLGLAPIIVEQIFGIIRAINAEGTPVLLVEQNADMALRIAHRGYVLATGEVTLTGSGEELLGNESVKQLYLGEI